MISCLSQSRLSVSHTTSSGPSLVFNPAFLNFWGADAFFSSFISKFRKNNSGNQELAFFIPAVAKQNLNFGHFVPFISILSHFLQNQVPLSKTFSCYVSGIAVFHIIMI